MDDRIFVTFSFGKMVGETARIVTEWGWPEGYTPKHSIQQCIRIGRPPHPQMM
jgi:hypothetical protein